MERGQFLENLSLNDECIGSQLVEIFQKILEKNDFTFTRSIIIFELRDAKIYYIAWEILITSSNTDKFEYSFQWP